MSIHVPNRAIAPAALVQRISHELVFAKDQLHRIELALEAALVPGCPRPQGDGAARQQTDQNIGELQVIDLVAQILGELATCLDVLSRSQTLAEADSLDAGEVLRTLRLVDLQRRLGGLAVPDEPVCAVELF